MPLPAPATSSVTLVDDLVAERQGGKNAMFFNNIAPEWRLRVQAYLDHGGSPAAVPKWPAIEDRKKSFLNLYISPVEGAVQKVALDELRDHGLTICPACGEPGRPNTLDHYLPKTDYPHFCVTPHNLFPMCDACQTQKGNKTGDAVEPRFFLHPYFDVFIAQQILALTIQPPYDKPTFNLRPVAALTAGQTRLVARHVRELGIVERYGRYFSSAYRRLLRNCDRMRSSDQNVAQTLQTFSGDAEVPSVNSWDHVFYSAVVADADLLNYLENDDLPPYL